MKKRVNKKERLTMSPTEKAFQKQYKSVWFSGHVDSGYCIGKDKGCYCKEIMEDENMF